MHSWLLAASVASVATASAASDRSLIDWAPRTPLPSSLDEMNSTEGVKHFASAGSGGTVAFWQLMQHLATQTTQSFCGVATACSAMNALRINAPVDPIYSPYAYFVQSSFFSDCVEKVVKRDTVLTMGMTLQQFAGAATCWQATAAATHAEDSTVSGFTAAASAAIGKAGLMVAINFARTGLDQVGGGHFSPLAAYDAASDRFLILDVARYKYPPVWAKAEAVFAAMNTTDSASERSRGWATLSADSGK